MKIYSQVSQLQPQANDLSEIYAAIERAGRVCYKSENKTTSDSAKEFVEKLKANGHLSVLEHGTVYLFLNNMRIPSKSQFEATERFYLNNPYSKVMTSYRTNGRKSLYITTNLRVLMENKREDDLRYITAPCGDHCRRYSFHITTDRATADELVRHRCASFSVESTRFCDYANGRFDSEVGFSLPEAWMEWDTEKREVFTAKLQDAEKNYLCLRAEGFEPQEARAVLPLSVKSELFMTAFLPDWHRIISLRESEKAHPTIRALAHTLGSKLAKAEADFCEDDNTEPQSV